MPEKTLIHSGIALPLRRLVSLLTSVRSFLVKMFKTRSFFSRDHRHRRPLHFFIYFTRNKKNKIHCGSFRMHYNWCSSRSWSVPTHVYYDSTWQCGAEIMYDESSELSGYLRWLEEKKVAVNGVEAAGAGAQLPPPPPPQRNEIDELADVFIAQCREKFILEKQESDRRFHDMQLARSYM